MFEFEMISPKKGATEDSKRRSPLTDALPDTMNLWYSEAEDESVRISKRVRILNIGVGGVLVKDHEGN